MCIQRDFFCGLRPSESGRENRCHWAHKIIREVPKAVRPSYVRAPGYSPPKKPVLLYCKSSFHLRCTSQKFPALTSPLTLKCHKPWDTSRTSRRTDRRLTSSQESFFGNHAPPPPPPPSVPASNCPILRFQPDPGLLRWKMNKRFPGGSIVYQKSTMLISCTNCPSSLSIIFVVWLCRIFLPKIKVYLLQPPGGKKGRRGGVP